MSYKYPEIRDVLMIFSKYVRDGNLTGNSKYAGFALLTARDEKTSKLLSNFLSRNSVKHEIIQGAVDIDIVFKFGQNEFIDTTVKEMDKDSDRMRNIVNHIMRAENYKGK